MTTDWVLLLAIIVVGLILAVLILNKKQSSDSGQLNNLISDLNLALSQNQAQMMERLLEKMAGHTDNTQQKLANDRLELTRLMQEELSKIERLQNQIQNLTKDQFNELSQSNQKQLLQLNTVVSRKTVQNYGRY